MLRDLLLRQLRQSELARVPKYKLKQDESKDESLVKTINNPPHRHSNYKNLTIPHGSAAIMAQKERQE